MTGFDDESNGLGFIERVQQCTKRSCHIQEVRSEFNYAVESIEVLPKATEPPGTSNSVSLPGEHISSSQMPPRATKLRPSCFVVSAIPR